jgi:hypothetical protein
MEEATRQFGDRLFLIVMIAVLVPLVGTFIVDIWDRRRK